MSLASREMVEIQIGLWNVTHILDVPTQKLSDETFGAALAVLAELRVRFNAEQDRINAEQRGR